jgi:cold shock CspA family protein
LVKILLFRKKQPSLSTSLSANECERGRQEGTVVKFNDRRRSGFGFIKRDSDEPCIVIYFSRKNLISTGQLPKIGDRVEFSLTKDAEGRPVATDILVQVNQFILLYTADSEKVFLHKLETSSLPQV